MFPDYAIQLTGIDAIVTGDGEDAFLEIVQRYDQSSGQLELGGIEGVWWISSDGQVVKNTERRSTKDLTAYPWPDRRRSEYQSYYLPGTKQPMVTTAITSRVIVTPMSILSDLQKQYRIRDIDDLLDEMEDCISLGNHRSSFY